MFKSRAFLLMIVLSLAAVVSAIAQPAGRQVVNQSIEWFALSSTVKIHKRIGIYMEGQFRYAQDFQPMQFQARIAPEYTINKHFSVVPIAYVYTWNAVYGKQPASFINDEHRIWEQVQYKHSISRVNFGHRLRLEQRFIERHHRDAEGFLVNEGYVVKANRLRYRFMATVPLNHAKMDPKTFYFNTYDEAFLSWGDGITFHEPDQNRIFAGLGYQVNKQFSFQAGCLYQMQIKSNGAKQENNIGVQAQLNYNFDLTKKEN